MAGVVRPQVAGPDRACPIGGAGNPVGAVKQAGNCMYPARGGAIALGFAGAQTGPANAAGIQVILKAQTQWREHQIIRGHSRCPDFCALVARYA